MKVRLACVDDLNEIMELYHLVSDMMEDSAYDIGWRKDVYPTKEIVLLDIEQQTLYVLEKNEKIIIYGTLCYDGSNSCWVWGI